MSENFEEFPRQIEEGIPILILSKQYCYTRAEVRGTFNKVEYGGSKKNFRAIRTSTWSTLH